MKLDLTKLKENALVRGDDNVLTKVAVGDAVANELKHHPFCLIGFRKRSDDSGANSKDTCNPPDTRSLEEVLVQIEEGICEGRTCFPLKDIYRVESERQTVWTCKSAIELD